MNSQKQLLALVALLTLALMLTACGGGGGTGSAPVTPPPVNPSNPPQITTSSLLPGALQGQPYTTTLVATGGKAPLHWSINPVPALAFVDGLTIDAATGVISGTANWSNNGTFQALVTDADSQRAGQTFTIAAFPHLSATPSRSTTVQEFQDPVLQLDFQGGVPPYHFSVASGSLPPGMRVDSGGFLRGGAYVPGDYSATISIQDSFATPETVTQQISVKVIAEQLGLQSSLPDKLPLNAPFSGKLVATGGTPPYTFAIQSGSMPAGLNLIDPATGAISGIPSAINSYFFTANVTDSASPAQTSIRTYAISVNKALGRNDSIATATPIADNGTLRGSISPYIDPPDKAPLPADADYYKYSSMSGAIGQFSVAAKQFNASNPLDTVLEIVDGNGVRFTTCRQPGDTSTNFNSACINDDVSSTLQDSALSFQVPGAPGTPTTFYVHVFDWRGDARPDMTYNLSVLGLVSPLSITSGNPIPAIRGRFYSQNLFAANGTGNRTFSILTGSLPPGLSLSSAGLISGSATTDGSFLFTVKVTDLSTPPQTATADFTMQVVDPLAIISPAVLPDACLNQPYTFAPQTSGGAPPFQWSFFPIQWVSINIDQATGVFSGTPQTVGKFSGFLDVQGIALDIASQTVSLTVKTCP